MIKEGLRERWNSLSRGYQRLALVLLLTLHASVGLLFSLGSLNFLDFLLVDSLPPDLVWLLQTFQLLCMGFGLIKILFDDLPSSKFRTILIIFSPFLFLIHALVSLHFLLLGQDLVASVRFDLGSLTISTLTWSSTYLAIAIGCTLTYSVQRYGNFAQSEYFMLGMYVGIAIMWTCLLYTSPSPRD